MGKMLPVLEQNGQYRAEPGGHPAEFVKDITPDQIAGTNVVFINMPLREEAVANVIPEGPLLMATNLRDNYGVNATVVDLNAYRFPDEEARRRGLKNGRHINDAETRELIEEHCRVHGEPHVIGFSGMITTLGWQQKVAKMVKEMFPDTLLVSGGGQANELKPTPLNPRGLFDSLFLPEIDALALSEGDDVILKITRDAKIIRERGWRSALQSGELEPYFYGEIDGRPRLRYCGARPIGPEKGVLPDLPFADLDLLKTDVFGRPILEWYINVPVWGDPRTANSSRAYFSMAPKTTSVPDRGCPHGCDYCLRNAQGGQNWAVRRAEHLAAELRRNIEKYGIVFHGYPGDNFAVTAKRIKDMVPIFREFVEMGVHWGTHTRLDEAAGLIHKPGGGPDEYIFEHPFRIQYMAEAGCVYIGFGPESAHPETLKVLNKGGATVNAGTTPVVVGGEVEWFLKAMVEGIRIAAIFGIHSNCTWIKGSPEETLERLKKTVRFIKWQEEFCAEQGIPASAVNKNMFTLQYYPGTKIVRHPKVRQELSDGFGLKLVKTRSSSNPRLEEYEPIFDENFRDYVLQLDEAVNVLHNPKTGRLLNFSDMTEDVFMQVDQYVKSDQLFRISDM